MLIVKTKEITYERGVMSRYGIEVITTASLLGCWSRFSGLELDDVIVPAIEHHADVAGLTIYVSVMGKEKDNVIMIITVYTIQVIRSMWQPHRGADERK